MATREAVQPGIQPGVDQTVVGVCVRGKAWEGGWRCIGKIVGCQRYERQIVCLLALVGGVPTSMSKRFAWAERLAGAWGACGSTVRRTWGWWNR